MRRHEWRVSVAAGVVSVLAWAIWLAWDRKYDIDPVTGSSSGPYQTWQVIGCVITLAVATVLASRGHHSPVAALLVAVPFTICWTVGAASVDESGLFAVGAVLIGVGLYLGALATAALLRARVHPLA